MKFISLHTKNTTVIYKNALCSAAAILVLVFIVLSVMVPVLLVSLLSPYSGIAESRVLYEQPRLQFKHQSIFVAEMKGRGDSADTTTTAIDEQLVACSTFPQFNALVHHAALSKNCDGVKYWTEDLDHDGTVDRVHFEQQLTACASECNINTFDLILFFDAKLKHKCALSPPAMLTHRLMLPRHAERMSSGLILLKAELQLKQYIEFTCPFPGRNTKTHFRDVMPNGNATKIEHYEMEVLLEQQKNNPAFFELDVRETYFKRDLPDNGLRVKLELDIAQLPARYHLSVWERLGQFWLYFASFFGISFYVMNKVKDYLFGRHIIRAWEVLPWKKLY